MKLGRSPSPSRADERKRSNSKSKSRQVAATRLQRVNQSVSRKRNILSRTKEDEGGYSSSCSTLVDDALELRRDSSDSMSSLAESSPRGLGSPHSSSMAPSLDFTVECRDLSAEEQSEYRDFLRSMEITSPSNFFNQSISLTPCHASDHITEAPAMPVEAKFALAAAEAERELLEDELTLSKAMHLVTESQVTALKEERKDLLRELEALREELRVAKHESISEDAAALVSTLVDTKLELANRTQELNERNEAYSELEKELVKTKLALARERECGEDIALRKARAILEERDAALPHASQAQKRTLASAIARFRRSPASSKNSSISPQRSSPGQAQEENSPPIAWVDGNILSEEDEDELIWSSDDDVRVDVRRAIQVLGGNLRPPKSPPLKRAEARGEKSAPERRRQACVV